MNQQLSIRFTKRIVALLLVTLNPLHAQIPPNASASTVHRNDTVELNQEKTMHRFKLLPDGGAIEITANDPSDAATRNAIRQHVIKIADMFAEGNFSIAMPVDGQKPQGVATMQRLKGQLYYTPRNLPSGGRVQITTENSEALRAVHEFLRFQMREDKTGESVAEPVQPKRKHPANNLGHDARPAPP